VSLSVQTNADECRRMHTKTHRFWPGGASQGVSSGRCNERQRLPTFRGVTVFRYGENTVAWFWTLVGRYVVASGGRSFFPFFPGDELRGSCSRFRGAVKIVKLWNGRGQLRNCEAVWGNSEKSETVWRGTDGTLAGKTAKSAKPFGED